MQLSYRLLSYVGDSQLPRINITNDIAPKKPSSFTDGSLRHPGTSLALGMFGIWEPGRDYATTGPEEHDFSRPVGLKRVHQLNGTLMAGILSGVYNSSTRAELAGVIACLPKPGGLHIALDNRSVVDRASAIIAGTFYRRKPWGLLNDGDLWQAFEIAIKQRGAKSVAISWTKGHSTWQQIMANSSNASVVGNSIADGAADLGFEAAGKSDINCVLEFHAAKLKA
jgi:hypothetical protein